MNTYIKLFLKDGRRLLLKNMQRKEIAIPSGISLECYVGVEVNKDGDEKVCRYGGKKIDETLHLICASEVVRCQPMGFSLKYGWLVPADKVLDVGQAAIAKAEGKL